MHIFINRLTLNPLVSTLSKKHQHASHIFRGLSTLDRKEHHGSVLGIYNDKERAISLLIDIIGHT